MYISLLMTTWPQWIVACSVCFKDPDSPLTAGLQKAILLLLVVLLGVLGCVARFLLNVRKRTRVEDEQ